MGQYAKVSGAWVTGSGLYRKESGVWVQYSHPEQILTAASKHIFFDKRSTKVTIAVHGAPGENVHIAASPSVFVNLDSAGEGTATIDAGTWIFHAGTSGYSETIEVTSGTTDVYLYPEGYIYWYGRIRSGATLGTAKGSTSYATPSITQNTNNIVLSATARYYQARHNTYATVYFTGVSVTGYTNLKFVISAVSGSSGTSTRTIGQASSTTAGFGTTITTADTHTVAIRSITSYPYIGARQYINSSTSTSNQNRTMTLAAIWME